MLRWECGAAGTDCHHDRVVNVDKRAADRLGKRRTTMPPNDFTSKTDQ
jgi:hypothetical protein